MTSLLAIDVPYIGLLGPRKRYKKMQHQWDRQRLYFTTSSLKRIHSPIGLDLGAETPDEIALSILGKIKTFFSQRTGGFLTERSGPIHERALDEKEQIAN